MPLIFCVLKQKILPAYKTINLLRIVNKEKEGGHYLAVKKLSTLLRGVTYGDFYCLNCLHSFRTENWYMKSHRMPYIIYADLECLIKKIDGCENNPENSSTTRIGDHITCGYSMSTIWGLDHVENKHIFYRRKDCMKKHCDSLKEYAKNIIGLQQEKMLPLTDK